MALSQRLEFRQTQGLVMTPQLMQAIKLLQLSSLDLAAYVEGEVERNPLLERASDDDLPTPGEGRGKGSGRTILIEGLEQPVDETRRTRSNPIRGKWPSRDAGGEAPRSWELDGPHATRGEEVSDAS